MKRKFLVAIFSVAVLFGSVAWGANTITNGKNTTILSAIDSDYSFTTRFGTTTQSREGVRVHAIMFFPAATDDVCSIEDATTGAVIFYAKAADAYDARVLYLNGVKIRPMMDFSDGTYTAGSTVVFIWAED